MDIIKKIQIKHFRSFLGSPSEYSLVVEDVRDLNLFSGGNDSGKSNFLRALNLFFNNKINNIDTLNFEKDFFIGKQNKTQKVIEISIDFDLSKILDRDRFLPAKFRISKFFDRNGFRNFLYTFSLNGKKVNIDSRSEQNAEVTKYFVEQAISEKEKENASRKEWRYRAKFSGFLNTISFEYIPAIRDNNYFSLLCGRVILQLKLREDNSLDKLEREKKQIKDYKKTLNNKGTTEDFRKLLNDENERQKRVQEIDKELKSKRYINKAISSLEEQINTNSNSLLKSINFLESEFKIGTNLQEFFNGFDIGTGINKNISFKSRGDGIQAKYIPEMLEFLSTISPQKYYIWGYEEPENSAEYSNQKILSESLIEQFSKTKQIFLTTHSEQFLSLYNENSMNVSLYHVKKLKSSDYGEYSQIYSFNQDKKDFLFNEKNELSSELGFSYITTKYAREIEDLKSSFIKEKQELEKNIELLKEQKNRVLFVEDEAHKLILEELLTGKNFKIVPIGTCDKVLACSEALNDRDNFFFLVDGDRKKGLDTTKKYAKHTHRLSKYCIENYLFNEDIFSNVISSLGKNITPKTLLKNVVNNYNCCDTKFDIVRTLFECDQFSFEKLDNTDCSELIKQLGKNNFLARNQYDLLRLFITEAKKLGKFEELFSEVLDFLRIV